MTSLLIVLFTVIGSVCGFFVGYGILGPMMTGHWRREGHWSYRERPRK